MLGSIAAAAVLFAGIALLMYPHVSNWLSEMERLKVMNAQTAVVEQAAPEDLSAYLKKAKRYNKKLAAGKAIAADPFGAGSTDGTREYRKLLDVAEDGVMGTISIPSVHIVCPIYHGVSDDVLERGAGHMPTTSLPVGGKSTHAVITGHTGLPSAKFFDDIDQLGIGDWFVVSVLGKDCAYSVYSIDVVLPEEVSSLGIEPGEDLCTLVTCTPYGVNTHRLLVHGKRCELPAEWLEAQKAAQAAGPQNVVAPHPIWPWMLAGLGIAACVVLVALAVHGARKLRRKRG